MRLTSTTIPEFTLEETGRPKDKMLSDVARMWEAGAFDATGDFDPEAWTVEWTVDEAAAEARKLLAETDWRVTRAAERGEALPTEWATYREALRTLINEEASGEVTWPINPQE